MQDYSVVRDPPISHYKMALLNLPSEIFQQVISETVTYENFLELRLVHSFFNDTIRDSAEYLTKQLLQAYQVSDHVLSLQYQIGDSGEDTRGAERKLSSFLRLHRDVATCIELEEVLDTHRERFAAWADVPAKGFGSLESVLIFSAFQREVKRSIEAEVNAELSTKVTCADPNNNHLIWLKLDQQFMDFVKLGLTIDDLQALMTIANFCAVSARFVDAILTSRYFFSDAGASDHWQNEQLGSALLAERILWRGPAWLAKMLRQNADKTAPTISAQRQDPVPGNDDHTMWTGSRAEAAILTANGLARFLWKERAQRLELERKAAETLGTETTVRRELKVDPAVWRGSSGGF